jgi:hypothetical protein
MRLLGAALSCGIVVLPSCYRYEYQPAGCPPPASPALRVLPVEVHEAAAARPRASGRVRDTDTGEPLPGATIEWVARPAATGGPGARGDSDAPSDTAARSAVGLAGPDGVFRLDSLPVGAQGEAIVRIRRLGYDASDQIVRPPRLAAGERLGIELRLRRAIMDGCNVGQYARKPWWTWW